MIRAYVKVLLFLVSYLPLFLILLVKNWDNNYFVGFMAILIAIPLFFLFILFRMSSSTSWDWVNIDKVDGINRIGLEYFVTYIIPFLDFQLGIFSDVLSLVILFSIMCFMYIKSDLIYMNPVLNMIGFNIYKLTSDGKEKVLITRKKKDQLQSAEELIELSDTVLLEKIGENNKSDK